MKGNGNSDSVFSRRLRSARKAVGISQMELGVRAGIDESSASARVNQYERGKHAPFYQIACNLARALDIPTAYLYCEDDSLAQLIFFYAGMTEMQKQTLLCQANELYSKERSGVVRQINMA